MPMAPPGNAELVRQIEPLAAREGAIGTALPEVSLIRASAGQQRLPLLYEPGRIIVAQGRKVVCLGDRPIHHDPDRYLVQTPALPLECEIHAKQWKRPTEAGAEDRRPATNQDAAACRRRVSANDAPVSSRM